jgi:hypothetical protein
MGRNASKHWKTRTIACSECNELFDVRHPRAKYCNKCKVKVRKEYDRYKGELYGILKTFAELDPEGYEKMCNEIQVPKKYLIRGKISYNGHSPLGEL